MLTVLSPWKLYYYIITLLTESVTIVDVIRVYFTTFSRTDSTLSSKSFCSTSLGIPTTSKHSLLEYWALAQRWCSMFTSLMDNSEFTFFVTKRSIFCLTYVSLFQYFNTISRHFRLHSKYNSSQILLQQLVQVFFSICWHCLSFSIIVDKATKFTKWDITYA